MEYMIYVHKKTNVRGNEYNKLIFYRMASFMSAKIDIAVRCFQRRFFFFNFGDKGISN